MAVADTNYVSTLAVTDVSDSGKTQETGAVNRTGMDQGNLYSYINTYITNFNGMNAKLDADTGVSGADYASLWNLNTAKQYKLSGTGMGTPELATALLAIETKMDGTVAKLNADAGVADDDYASIDTTTVTNATGVSTTGLSQGAIVNQMDKAVTAFNVILAKLDADA